MKSHGDKLVRVKRLFRRALVGLLVVAVLATGLAVLAAPDQSYELVQGIIAAGGGRMITRYYEANGTAGQVVAPRWSADSRHQMVSGFWSRDVFLQVYPTPRPTPTFDKLIYMPLIVTHR